METPDIVVIQGECNDNSPSQNQEKLMEEEIAKEIINGVNEIISGLICCKGQYHNSRVLKVTDYLQKFCFENRFYFINNSKIKRLIHLFGDGLHLLESAKVILANNLILNPIQSVNSDWNLWNSERRGTEEGGPNKSLTKEISGRGKSNTNVLKNGLDLIDAKTGKLQYSSNPLIAYLNINSIQNMINALRVISKIFPLGILCIDETKLNDSFHNHQFKIDVYQFPPFRRDRNKFGKGKSFMLKMVLQ